MKDHPVLLAGSERDPHIRAVAEQLKARDVDTLVLDTLDFPEHPAISLGPRLGAITIEGREVSAPASVYVRDLYVHPLGVGVDVGDEMEADWRRTMIAFREKSQVLLSLLARWAKLGIPVYNPMPADWKLAKPMQLALLEQAGIPVPDTLWSNDPVAVKRFAEGRRIAYKPVAGGAATKELGPSDLTEERLRALRGAPVTFQELLEGDNYRVYCLDDAVIACFRIVGKSLDYRQNEEVIEQAKLPEEVLGQCLEAARTLGLRWTGMDLRGDAGGNLKFLELNSSPMFLGFDRNGGTDILGHLTDTLASHTKRA